MNRCFFGINEPHYRADSHPEGLDTSVLICVGEMPSPASEALMTPKKAN